MSNTLRYLMLCAGLTLVSHLQIYGQTHSLYIEVLDQAIPDFIEKKSTHNNQSSAQEELDGYVLKLISLGHLTASIDSVARDSISTRASLFVGDRYQWLELSKGLIPEGWMEELNFELEQFAGRPVSAASYERMASKLLTYAENNGYPFATVNLREIKVTGDGGISAQLQVDPHRFFVMDTMSITGNAKVSKAFLYSYLGFKPGIPYNEAVMRKIGEKLSRLPFVQSGSRQKIYFTGNKVAVHLELKERKTDQIDGLVGLAPNPVDNSLLITGEANVDLKNILKRGIAFDMHWKSFQARSQQLSVGGTYPYLLHRPIGIDGRFEYWKFDTMFFTIRSNVGFRYLFRGTDYVKFYYQKNASALITVDTGQIRVNKRIPTSNPVDVGSYGLEINLRKLDYINNPRKGYQVYLNGNVGSRNILRDLRIEQVVFRNAEQQTYSVYDSISLKSVQGSFAWSLDWFIPIKKKSTVLLGFSGKHLMADQIFFNDLYRFGGTKSLRGFNEESLLASSYQMLNLEYRYLFSENSYFQLFANGALTNKMLDNVLETDMPIGFGTGVSLEVRGGILSLAYAVGREQGNPIQPSKARIHFGIINFL